MYRAFCFHGNHLQQNSYSNCGTTYKIPSVIPRRYNGRYLIRLFTLTIASPMVTCPRVESGH